MNLGITAFFNRVTRYNYKYDGKEFSHIDEIRSEMFKILNEHLIGNPERTKNWALNVYKEIDDGQKVIFERNLEPLEKLIVEKKTHTLSKQKLDLLANNSEQAHYVLTELDDIKYIILEAIAKFFPELVERKLGYKKQTGYTNTYVYKLKRPGNDSEDLEAKYLKSNGKRFTQAQIALFIIYKRYTKRLYDPRQVSKTLFHDLARDFGYTSSNSPYLIFEKWRVRKDSDIQRLGHKKPKNQKIDIEEVITLLDDDESILAQKDIENLELKIN